MRSLPSRRNVLQRDLLAYISSRRHTPAEVTSFSERFSKGELSINLSCDLTQNIEVWKQGIEVFQLRGWWPCQ